MIQCVLIPESYDLLDLWARKKELSFLKSLKNSEEKRNCLINCCIPHQNLDETITKIDQQIEKLTSKGFRFSGNAFICVDSNLSFQKIIQHFSLFQLPFWKSFCFCFKRRQRTPTESLLFSRMSSDELMYGVLASAAPSPDDISWKNLNKDSHISFVKRFALNILAIILMVFFTTPASLITVLGLFDIIDRIIDSNPPEPGSFSNIIEKNLSPMLIILVNQLLLSVIDTLAFQKKMIKLSSTQLTIFNLCFLYMSINSFIIPALSMTTMESIFSFLSTNSVEKVETLLKTFYLKDTGSLFIIMLIQAGTFSFTFYLLDFPIFS